jgi:hypothetical protein
MTIYAITEHHDLHTCPADPQPHPWMITRTLVHVTPGRPCLTPVTIRLANTVATIPCGRHNPTNRQCGNCRTVVTTIAITAIDHGDYQPPLQPAAPAGPAYHRCLACGAPVVAALKRHILCPPVTRRSRSAA